MGLFSFCLSYQIIFQYHIPGASQFCACTELQIHFSLILFSLTEPKPDQQHFLQFQPNNSYLPWYLTWKTLLLSCFNHSEVPSAHAYHPLVWLRFLTHHPPSSMIASFVPSVFFWPQFPPLCYISSMQITLTSFCVPSLKCCCCLVAKSCQNSMQIHGLQHARPF